ncbi:hypothetical protein M9H77_35082 [Catharanthus roseus]|uniref:Uncharacterized protein n=1 Tax=Catharanthus roseus TaxID=4058 RepID=A0ACB9ZQ55_CATRO|nr:hypothetical protein M9H77_35082 [Catharanthus roseus]
MEIISACYSGRQCGGRDYLCLLLCCCGPTVISPPQPLSLLMVLILPKSFGYKSVPVQGLPFDYNKVFKIHNVAAHGVQSLEIKFTHLDATISSLYGYEVNSEHYF